MIRRPPRSTHCISSAASDVYKRQQLMSLNDFLKWLPIFLIPNIPNFSMILQFWFCADGIFMIIQFQSVSYTHLRAHETRHDLVCRLLLEKKKKKKNKLYY
eukprot:TRINITY_DN11628_c0_g1_i1.p1 TRINITY_DN11628_c0_g1~~TRINITY_DN11628_c0_g1_i1.p1  ORF type:complete len:101 (-),score=27.85 TRINITY_DN11628_c0_g1_i1:41-343(-)